MRVGNAPDGEPDADRDVVVAAGHGASARLVTIGVYAFGVASFLRELHDAGVGVLVDVRQRRGVRRREYAWANARRLQEALAGEGIAYEHHRELAPSTGMRRLQYAEDDRRAVGHRSRPELADEFARRYRGEVLDAVDLGPLAALAAGGTVPALLCVETDPEACHHSLMAERLVEQHRVAVEHRRP